jgi:peptidoglycan-associated lipoprotein
VVAFDQLKGIKIAPCARYRDFVEANDRKSPQIGRIEIFNHNLEPVFNQSVDRNRLESVMVDKELRMATNSAISRLGRIVAVIGLVSMVAACANKPNTTASIGGSASPGSSQDFVVNVGDRVFFETDSTELTVVSRTTLDRQAGWLKQYPRYAITIEGHADERGTREYNIALGARRAEVVRAYLVSQGIAANRFRTISYGKERPVAVCNDISCWSQNRRAVTVVNTAGS